MTLTLEHKAEPRAEAEAEVKARITKTFNFKKEYQVHRRMISCDGTIVLDRCARKKESKQA